MDQEATARRGRLGSGAGGAKCFDGISLRPGLDDAGSGRGGAKLLDDDAPDEEEEEVRTASAFRRKMGRRIGGGLLSLSVQDPRGRTAMEPESTAMERGGGPAEKAVAAARCCRLIMGQDLSSCGAWCSAQPGCNSL